MDIVAISVALYVRNRRRSGEREALTNANVVLYSRFCPFLEVPTLTAAYVKDSALKCSARRRQDGVRVLQWTMGKFVDEDGLDPVVEVLQTKDR